MPASLKRRARILAVVVILTAGAALGGCSARPGVAATASYTGFDGAPRTVIVTEEVLSQTAPLFAPSTPRTSVAEAIITAPMYLEVGGAYGVEPAQEDVLGHLRQSDPERTVFPQEAYNVVAASLVIDMLAGLDSEQVAQANADLARLDATMDVVYAPAYEPGPDWRIQDGAIPVDLG